MGYKKDKNQIKEHARYLKRRFKFQGLLHFTDFSNLKTILDEGYLYSRSHCENNNINFLDGANHDVVDKASEYVHECVRFYYRGKTPTLYDNEGIKLKEYCDKTHIPIPVYLLFDEELLSLDNTNFANGNATNSEIDNTARFFKEMDWDAIFHNTWFEPDERDYIVNKRHAELLSEDPVSLKYLKKIIFRCEADLKRAINVFGNDERFIVRNSLFSDKNQKEAKSESEYNNFIKDYRIGFEKENDKINLVLDLDFNKTYKEKSHQLQCKVLNCKGKEVEIKKEIVDIDTKNLRINRKKRRVIFYGIDDNWAKLNIYMNGYLSIEQPINSFNKDIRAINKSNISYLKNKVDNSNKNKIGNSFLQRIIQVQENKKFIKLYEELNMNMVDQNKSHYIEFVSIMGDVISKKHIEINQDESIIDIKLECPHSRLTVRRYIDNILFYEFSITGIRNDETKEFSFLNPLR